MRSPWHIRPPLAVPFGMLFAMVAAAAPPAAELEICGFGGAVVNDTVAVASDLGNDFGFVLPEETRDATFTVTAIGGDVSDLAVAGVSPSFAAIDPAFGATDLAAGETTSLSLRFTGIAGTGRVEAEFTVSGGGAEETVFLVGGTTADGTSPVLDPGLHTFSLADDVAADIAFGDLDPKIRAFAWDPEAERYRERSAVSLPAPGTGYFIRNQNPTEPLDVGVAVSGTVVIDLDQGWGLYGVPALETLTWDLDAIRIRRGNQTRTLRSAAGTDWCAEYAWVWRVTDGTGDYAPVFPGELFTGGVDTIGPWEAFWFFSDVDGLEMLIDVGEGGTAISHRQPEVAP